MNTAAAAVSGVVVVPSQWYLEMVWAHLQSEVTLIPRVAVAELEGIPVFTLRANQSGHIMQWCIVSRRYFETRMDHIYGLGALFAFFPNHGYVSSVEAMLSFWLGPQCVAQMGDSRFLAVSQCLTRGRLYWGPDEASPVFGQRNPSNHDLAAAEAASLEQEEQERNRRRKSRGEMPATMTKRLCRNRPCQKARSGQPLCVACRENVASVVFLDCCHVSACENCICEDWDKGVGNLACFVCRLPCVLGPASLYVSENCV